MIVSLVARNNRVFLRNKMLVFLSLLTVFILIALFAIFLKELQVDAIEQYVPITSTIKIMVSEWMIAGLLTIISMTTTLGVFGIYVKDLETKTTSDFLVTATSRYKIQLSYVISAFLVGFTITFIGLIGCELYLVMIGGDLLSFSVFIKVVGILILAVMMSSVINLFIVLFINTETAYSTICTIFNTMLGFLCGIYVPMAVLPDAVQKIIQLFPVSHVTVLLREAFMSNSIEQVFAGKNEYAQNYRIDFGIVYEINGSILTSASSIAFIIGTISILCILSVIIYINKFK